ncbi:MAG: MarR family winged helix-turn-helix transcriptional regulator [Solirubrobacteraceae bacterium]
MGSAAASAQATPTELHEVADVLVAQMARIRRAGRRYAGRPAELSLLTGAQLELIKLVRRRPRVSVAEAASELGLAANTVSTLVRQLCEMGLLQRRVSETDRRMARLELSAGIRRKVGAWRDRRVTSLAAEIAELSDDEQQLLARSVELLAKVADGLERAGAAER